MLSIKPIGSSSQELRYYTNLGQDYYLHAPDGKACTGTWWGRGADSLGLRGTVEEKELRNLLGGYSPDGFGELVQNAGDTNRRSAFDLTWSVPKSVSVAWSQAPREMRRQIEGAAERSLFHTLDVFREMCGMTRRGHAGQRVEQAGLVAAIFRHDTARGIPGHAPDPNLHWHVVLGNAVVRADGSTGAFDARPLFGRHMKMALGALFRTELSKELESLGLTSHRPLRQTGRPASWFELDAVPGEVVREFSKRRGEIEKWLREHAASGAKAAERAALKTRHQKGHFSRDELFSAWHETAARHTFGWNHIKARLGSRPTARDERRESEDAVTKALVRLTEERAHFSELELTRYTAEESQGRGVGIRMLRQAVRERLNQSAEIVALRESNGERQFTTREMLATERQMLTTARALSRTSTHEVSNQSLAKVLDRFPTLRPEQREAVRYMVGRGDLCSVVGIAGSGKTFMLRVANEAWKTDGFHVVGTALAAKAAQGLEDGSGIESLHIHKLLRDLEGGSRDVSEKTVLVVDEAGMLGTRSMERLISIANEKRAKLVCVGDHRQLQAIDAGSPFRAIAERLGRTELTEIIRQRQSWARDAVAELAHGRGDSALAQFAERGLLHIAPNREAAIEKLVCDWGSHVSGTRVADTLIFTGTNLESINVNRLCQITRLRNGELGRDFVSVAGESVHLGDRVMFTRNNPALCVRNGQLGTVVAISPETNRLRVNLDDGMSVAIDAKVFEHLKLGYAITTHKGQGVTVENSYILTGGQMTDREISYVQSSRATGETRLYADLLSGCEDVQRLAKQMSRSRAKYLAHDYLVEAV